MRRFEFKDDKSYKFWQIALTDKSYTVQYGRIGTKGQEQTKEFASAAAARTAHDKLIAEKLAKGYVETTQSKAAPASPRTALENAIVANPDDLGAHAAYADWLIEQGDPRGEFIQVQLALEDEKRPAKARKELKQREEQLLKRYQREWLGELAPYLLHQRGIAKLYVQDGEIYRFGWARGQLETLDVPFISVAFARLLAHDPTCRWLRQLILRNVQSGDGKAYPVPSEARENVGEYVGLYALSQEVTSLPVRAFQCGTSRYTTLAFTAGIVGLIRKMPCLETLTLYASLWEEQAEMLTELEHLQSLRTLEIAGCYRFPLAMLAANRSLPQLKHLRIGLATDAEEGIAAADVEALLASPHLQGLVELRLDGCEDGMAICKALAKSPLRRHLRVLGLSRCALSKREAAALARCTDLHGLQVLDVSENWLSEKDIQGLKDTGIGQVVANDQKRPGEPLFDTYEGIME